MGFSKPSVSRAVGLLRKEGYITVNTDGHLLFTEKGLKKASDVLERHRTLTEFLETVIHVSPEIAEKTRAASSTSSARKPSPASRG